MRELARKIQEITDMMTTEGLTSATQRQHVTSMAMATAVAYSLALPTGAVHSPKSWYMTNGFPGATDIVGRLNESFIPVDVASVMTIVRNIWTLRYNILHVPNSHAAFAATYEAVASGGDEIAKIHRQLFDNGRSEKFYTNMIQLMASHVTAELNSTD